MKVEPDRMRRNEAFRERDESRAVSPGLTNQGTGFGNGTLAIEED
jgi:hypothetical protein